MISAVCRIVHAANINGRVYPYHNNILAAPPSPPQALMSRVLESDTNYFTVEVTWEPLGNDSRVDFYHFKVVADSERISYTLMYTGETPNTKF